MFGYNDSDRSTRVVCARVRVCECSDERSEKRKSERLLCPFFSLAAKRGGCLLPLSALSDAHTQTADADGRGDAIACVHQRAGVERSGVVQCDCSCSDRRPPATAHCHRCSLTRASLTPLVAANSQPSSAIAHRQRRIAATTSTHTSCLLDTRSDSFPPQSQPSPPPPPPPRIRHGSATRSLLCSQRVSDTLQ